MRSSFVFLPAALLMGCFNPNTSGIVIICDPANPCLDGQSCVQGRCVQASSLDMSVASEDGQVRDLMSIVPGCTTASSGKQVGAAWACSGAFVVGKARMRCAAGFVVCPDAVKVDQPACNALTGFFAGDEPGYDVSFDPPNAMCGPDSGPANRYWFGCGQAVQPDAGTNFVYSRSANPCKGFTKTLACQPGSGWDCFAGNTLDKVANSHSYDGVLCCPS